MKRSGKATEDWVAQEARSPGCSPREVSLTDEQILRWADDHRRATGIWPTTSSGLVAGAEQETWSGINASLWCGGRGLAGGRSLARLLAERRGKRNPSSLPPLTEE